MWKKWLILSILIIQSANGSVITPFIPQDIDQILALLEGSKVRHDVLEAHARRPELSPAAIITEKLLEISSQRRQIGKSLERTLGRFYSQKLLELFDKLTISECSTLLQQMKVPAKKRETTLALLSENRQLGKHAHWLNDAWNLRDELASYHRSFNDMIATGLEKLIHEAYALHHESEILTELHRRLVHARENPAPLTGPNDVWENFRRELLKTHDSLSLHPFHNATGMERAALQRAEAAKKASAASIETFNQNRSRLEAAFLETHAHEAWGKIRVAR